MQDGSLSAVLAAIARGPHLAVADLVHELEALQRLLDCHADVLLRQRARPAGRRGGVQRAGVVQAADEGKVACRSHWRGPAPWAMLQPHIHAPQGARSAAPHHTK